MLKFYEIFTFLFTISVDAELLRAGRRRRLVRSERDGVGDGQRDGLCDAGRRHEGGKAIRHAQQRTNWKRGL